MQPHIILAPSENTGVTISGTVGTALPDPANNVVGAVIIVETADVRMKWDGNIPLQAGADGSQLMRKDSVWEIMGRDILVAMRFVPVSSDAYVAVGYLTGG